MSSHRKRIEQANLENMQSYNRYKAQFDNYALSCIECDNMPKQYLSEKLEKLLHYNGTCLFYYDDDLRDYIVCEYEDISQGESVTGYPIRVQARAENGYTRNLNEGEFVVFYNNMLHENTCRYTDEYAIKISAIDRAIDVNISAQRTPQIICCNEKQRLTMINLIEQYDSNTPFIFGTDSLGLDNIKVFPLNAPLIAPELYELKTKLFNECLGYLGIPNISYTKKERMVKDEVTRGMGGTIASQYSRITPRKEGARQCKELFGLDLDFHFRDDFDLMGGGESGKLHNEIENDL